MQRRTFLLGGAGGTTLFALTACTSPSPEPSASPTTAPTASATAEPAPSDVPEPVSMTRSRWSADPYALGAFSYLVVGGTGANRQVLGEPVGTRLFFAGEATSVLAPASVSGARASGERAAFEVARAGAEGERIAVIGAGMAGAAAARRLTDAGFDVSVIEARDRVGGRIDSRGDGGDDDTLTVELGAGMLTSDDSDLRDALRAAGVSVVSLGEGRDIRDPLGLELDPSTVGADAVAAAVAAATARTGDVSLASALALSPIVDPLVVSPDGTTPADRLESELRSVGVAWAADPDQLSASNGLDDGPRAHGTSANGLLVTGGYKAVIDDLLEEITVWTSSVVLEVVYTDDGVSIRLGTGESLQVDRVVITVPAAVLASDDIRFTPPLPTTRTLALRGIGTGASDVIWLRFDEPFWSTDATRWSVVGGDLDIVEWINLEPSTGQAVLIGLVGGERAIALAELDDGEVLNRARLSLEPFLGG